MMRIIEIFIEVCFIVASPLIIGVGIGILVYDNNPNRSGMAIGVIISFIGLFSGIIGATKVWRKTGTSNFMSRVNASPELNNKVDKE
ncbi:MAG: hypothetical protein EBZ58_01790 [Bacteroidetes bacterium]|nr:hypothetical protein [Bacteroidota bacterium]